MPLSASATRAALAAQATETSNPVKVNLQLVFRGVNFVPTALYDALDAVYGTVASDKDVQRHKTYQWTITP